MTIRSQELSIDGQRVRVTDYHGQFLLLTPVVAAETFPSDLGRRLFDHRPEYCQEVIATEREVCLKVDDRYCADLFLRLIADIQNQVSDKQQVQTVELPVWFHETADWDIVCRSTQLSRSEYIDRLLECRLQVAMIGFLPGFLYLTGLPERLHVPRKTTPDRRTPANSFAVGGHYAGIYSLESPAGWNIIGSIGVDMLQTDRLPPVRLQPGDQVKLVAGTDRQLLQRRYVADGS